VVGDNEEISRRAKAGVGVSEETWIDVPVRREDGQARDRLVKFTGKFAESRFGGEKTVGVHIKK
jgi:hypothetical protein